MAGLNTISNRIDAAIAKAGRKTNSVALIAVSKIQPLNRIEAVLAQGHRVFGENRVQEAAGKWPGFKERYDGIELHLIGPLQTNKVRQAVELFDVIHSVDRLKLARKLADEMGQANKNIPCFLQINTGEEPQKAGCMPSDADAFISTCVNELQLDVAGLLCIPPADEEPSLHFSLLKKIADRNGLKGLSMGMSGDFETAIALGATHIRVGSAIFGARVPAKPPE